MPYDEDIAARLRAALAGEPDVDERKLFGGLGFLVGGHMAVAASHDGGVLARVDPGQSAALTAQEGVAPMVMRGSEMAGWLRVAPDAVADDTALGAWAARGVAYVRTLPPKA